MSKLTLMDMKVGDRVVMERSQYGSSTYGVYTVKRVTETRLVLKYTIQGEERECRVTRATGEPYPDDERFVSTHYYPLDSEKGREIYAEFRRRKALARVRGKVKEAVEKTQSADTLLAALKEIIAIEENGHCAICENGGIAEDDPANVCAACSHKNPQAKGSMYRLKQP